MRLYEHFTKHRDRSRQTEVSSHDINVHDKINKNDWEVWVLHQEFSDFDRKAIESWFIFKLKPTLNLSKGSCLVGLDRCEFKLTPILI